MTLNKQSIRSTQTIYLNRSATPSDKLEVITLSENWTEKEEETISLVSLSTLSLLIKYGNKKNKSLKFFPRAFRPV